MPPRLVVSAPTIRMRGAVRPKDYVRWNPVRKLEHAFETALDNVQTVLEWDPHSLDNVHFRAWTEVTLAVLNCSAKVGIARARAKDEAALAEIWAGLKRRATAPVEGSE